MAFDDFLGNRPILETVRSQLASCRLPHSMLFTGVSGIGKWTLAQFIAKACNCLRLKDDFCNGCPNCQRISENAHPDVKNVAPEGQFIKIDQMRSLSREVFFKPFEGKCRIFIMDEAEKLRDEAANSILKTLEEPPDTSILILITSRPNDLLPTIRSRCQMYPFAPLPLADVELLLQGRTSYSSEERQLLARIAGGSLGKAVTIDLAEYRRQRDEMLALLEACSRNFLYANAARAASGWLDKRKQAEFDSKTGILFTLLRDLFLLKAGAETQALTHADIAGKLATLSSLYSINQLMNATQSLDHLEAGMRRNLNRGLAADQFVLRLGGVTSNP
ncbi:MAG: DNA polymerase III subunit delta' [Acidobacteria bacterium]|nr:DNA polymerase III subunit delta' [Acidobacteriota bacterium]